MCQNPKHISGFTSYEKIPIRQVLGEPKYNFLGRFYKGILQLLEGFRLCGTWCLSATYKISVLPAAERSHFLWTCLAAMSKVPAQRRLGQTLPLLVWETATSPCLQVPLLTHLPARLQNDRPKAGVHPQRSSAQIASEAPHCLQESSSNSSACLVHSVLFSPAHFVLSLRH